MSSLFSSPSKQAQGAANSSWDIAQKGIGEAENYTDTQEKNLRSAIPNASQNPFLMAGQSMRPSTYEVDPNATMLAGPGAMPPGAVQGAPTPTLRPGANGPRMVLPQGPPQVSPPQAPPGPQGPPQPAMPPQQQQGPQHGGNPFLRNVM